MNFFPNNKKINKFLFKLIIKNLDQKVHFQKFFVTMKIIFENQLLRAQIILNKTRIQMFKIVNKNQQNLMKKKVSAFQT